MLVYIHGGGYFAGSPASPWYDGASFNRDGVVTVSVSYRLGFDGFGWIEDAPHNRGVRDWLLALEWVRDNIANFGGDPSRVTIAGQSAGGGAVFTLLGMPAAQPLFHSAYCDLRRARRTHPRAAEELGRSLAAEAGVAPTRAGLSTVSEERLMKVQNKVTGMEGGLAGGNPHGHAQRDDQRRPQARARSSTATSSPCRRSRRSAAAWAATSRSCSARPTTSSR